MDAELRMSTINDFKKSKTSKICLASIHIANTSITLTECSAIVYAEKTWHYPTYEQSLGRINRPGQTRESKVYTFQYVNSLDQLQADNLMGKGSVVNDIARQSHLSPDAWKRVFKGMY
jgi:SNF2 family DNA or RNA helicase